MKTEKNEYFYTVREELKELRMLERNLNSLSKAIQKLEKNRALSDGLSCHCHPYESENCKAKEDFRELISRLLTLKDKYYPIIARLDALDRIIILDGYIDKTPYKKLGKEIGYTKEGIQKRTYIIIGKIADILKKRESANNSFECIS